MAEKSSHMETRMICTSHLHVVDLYRLRTTAVFIKSCVIIPALLFTVHAWDIPIYITELFYCNVQPDGSMEFVLYQVQL